MMIDRDDNERASKSEARGEMTERLEPFLSSIAVSGLAESFTLSEADESDQPEQQLRIAGATADPVKDYLRQIGKVPLLTAQQEVELSKRIEAGLLAERVLKGQEQLSSIEDVNADELEWLMQDGAQAKDHLTQANLRLVVSLAKRYTGRGMSFLDLIQEANIGLIRGVEKFDYTKGFKFSTYATWWIRQAITRSLADQSRTIRVPVHMVELMGKVRRTKLSMLQDLNREPTIEELTKELDITPEKLKEMENYGRQPISLNAPLGEVGDGEFGDLIEDTKFDTPETATDEVFLKEALLSALDFLPARDAGVIMMRYGLEDGQPRTLDEIGKVYGVTRERIRQLEAKAMPELLKIAEQFNLREYIK